MKETHFYKTSSWYSETRVKITSPTKKTFFSGGRRNKGLCKTNFPLNPLNQGNIYFQLQSLQKTMFLQEGHIRLTGISLEGSRLNRAPSNEWSRNGILKTYTHLYKMMTSNPATAFFSPLLCLSVQGWGTQPGSRTSTKCLAEDCCKIYIVYQHPNSEQPLLRENSKSSPPSLRKYQKV